MAINVSIPVDTEKLLRNTLSEYLCYNVWNTPLTECRRNITLRAITKGRSKVNFCDLGCQYTSLPYNSNTEEKHSYYVYAAAKCCMGGLVVDPELDSIKKQLADTDYNDGWLRLDTYLNLRPFDLRIHGIHGEWLCRKYIYIKNHPYEDMFLIAIDMQMANQILGTDYNFTTIYMSVYYDSDNDLNNLSATSPKIQCYYPKTVSDLNLIFNEYNTSNKEQTIFFIDGREALPMSLDDIQIKQYIEIVKDPDIICSITLDMTDPKYSNMYRSAIDNTFKYIVHIPKDLNPDNDIISHNTCDMFIRPMNPAIVKNARLKGLFVHRFDTSSREYTYALTTDKKFYQGKNYYTKNGTEYKRVNITPELYSKYDGKTKKLPPYTYYVRISEYLHDSAITQITHNDFGISEKNLQPYMEFIGSSECSIRVVIRKHSKSNKLTSDNNFINLLYQFDDETILKFLNGDMQDICPFWKAVNLEQSEWIKMMFEVPHPIEDESTQHYINALGYFNTLSIITPKVIRAKYVAHNTHALSFSIPKSILTERKLTLTLSINGLTLDPTKYTYTRNNQYIDVDINDDVQLLVGDDLVAEIFDIPEYKAEYFRPTSSNNTFNISEDYNLYLVNEDAISVNQEDPLLKEYYNTESESFSLISNKEQYLTETDDNQIIFKDTTYNRLFLITSKQLFKHYSHAELRSTGNVELGTLTVDDKSYTRLLHSGKLEIPAKKWSSDEIIIVPILTDDLSIIPFCNGRELIENIDYSLIDIKDTNGNLIGKDVLFSVNAVGDANYHERDSYLKHDDNNFHLVATTNSKFINATGFSMTDCNTYSPLYEYSVIEEIIPYIYWFNRLCVLIGDGKEISSITQSNGMLHIYDRLRNGALYQSRGIIPTDAKLYVDRFFDVENDISKLKKICEYLRSLDEYSEETRVLIEHSHHITSIMLNTIIEDVVSGKLQLHYTPDDKVLLSQVEDYYNLMKYDPVFISKTEINIINAGSSIINGTYILEDQLAKDTNRIWKNKENNAVIKFDIESKRWILSAKSMFEEKIYYHAEDFTMKHNPWELYWNMDQGSYPRPLLQNDGLDYQFIDIFPSYSSDLHVVDDDVLLKRVIKALLPTDSTKDGDTLS